EAVTVVAVRLPEAVAVVAVAELEAVAVVLALGWAGVAGGGETGALLRRAGRRLHPEPGRGRGRRLDQVLGLLLDPADAGPDLVQHRLEVAVDPARLPPGQGGRRRPQPALLGLDPEALALGLLPDQVGGVAGLLQHRPGILLGLGPHLLGRLEGGLHRPALLLALGPPLLGRREGALLDPRPLGPGLLEGPAGLSLDLAGPVLGRPDDLGPLPLRGVAPLLR